MPNPQGNIKDHLLYFTTLVKDVRGDFAEFGVFEGGIIDKMIPFQGTRQIWAFDTFDGIPALGYDPVLDSNDPPGKWRPDSKTLPYLESLLNVRVIKGLFQNTLPSCSAGTFALVHLDCDNYASYKTVLDWLPAHLTDGSVVVIDDIPFCKGAVKAVDEFCEQHTKLLRKEMVTHFIWGSRNIWEQVKV